MLLHLKNTKVSLQQIEDITKKATYIFVKNEIFPAANWR